MSWVNPGWLWALLGVAVPLLIHLLNASRGKRLAFPALKFAVASKARRVRSVALREPVLLALRMALLILLSVWLAGPTWQSSPSSTDMSPVLVSPLALQLSADGVTDQLSALDLSSTTPRQLAPGLPPLDAPAVYHQPATVAIKEIAEDWPDSPTVVVLDHPLDRLWATADHAGESALDQNLVTLTPGKVLSVGLSVGPQRQRDGRYLRAALAALASDNRLRWEEFAETSNGEKRVDVWISLGTPADQPKLNYQLQLRDAPAGDRWVSFDIGGESFRLKRAQPLGRGEPLAVDDEGQALVSIVSTEGSPLIQFAGQFDPDVNTLVSGGLFPDQLGQWLTLVGQMPQAVKVADTPTSNSLLAVIALLLWLVERLWALNRPVGDTRDSRQQVVPQ